MRLQVDHIGQHALTDADVADLAAAATAGDMPTVTPTATWVDLGFVPINPSGFDPWRPLSESPLVESPARAQSPAYHSASSGWCNLWGGDDAISSCASSPAGSPRGSPAWSLHGSSSSLRDTGRAFDALLAAAEAAQPPAEHGLLHLILDGHSLSDAGLAAVAAGRFRRLRSLRLHCAFGLTGLGLAELARLTELDHFSTRHCLQADAREHLLTAFAEAGRRLDVGGAC